MKFSINQNELQNALGIVLKGVSTRSTLPVLSGVLIEAAGDSLNFQATDLELSIQFSSAALVEEEGRAVFPGKLFSEIVKNLPDAAVHVRADDEQANISCDASTFSIKTLNPEDFPSFPQVQVESSIEVPFPVFSNMVRRVARMVSRDETRAILTGVLVCLEDGYLKMVATDSYRLAVTQTELENAPSEGFRAVISGSFLQDIASLPKTESSIRIALSQNQIVVSCQGTVFISRRIEGTYPNYKQLLPSGFATRAVVSVDALSAAVKRASLLGSSISPVKFDVNRETQTMQLTAALQDVGSAQDLLSCTVEGDDTQIAFNYSYVLDGLAIMPSDSVALELQSGMKPGIFRAIGPDDFLYLVMPVRIS